MATGSLAGWLAYVPRFKLVHLCRLKWLAQRQRQDHARQRLVRWGKQAGGHRGARQQLFKFDSLIDHLRFSSLIKTTKMGSGASKNGRVVGAKAGPPRIRVLFAAADRALAERLVTALGSAGLAVASATPGVCVCFVFFLFFCLFFCFFCFFFVSRVLRTVERKKKKHPTDQPTMQATPGNWTA